MAANLVDALLTAQSICEAEACAACVLAPLGVMRYAKQVDWQPERNLKAVEFWIALDYAKVAELANNIEKQVEHAYNTAQSVGFAWILYAPMQPGDIAEKVGIEKINAARALRAATIGLNYVQQHKLLSESFRGRGELYDD